MRYRVSTAAIAWVIGAMPAYAQDASPPAAVPAAAPAPVAAQTPATDAAADAADEAAGEADASGEVVVTGARAYGATVGTVRPEQTLNPADIRSYGVSSVAELIEALGPQTNAAAGPPVVLLNGKRVSSFAEIRDIPPEAILRTEILPEEVSLSYGYAANQKVVNIVLRRRFDAWTGELGAGASTEGGRADGRANANLLQIQRQTRVNIDATYTRAGRLLESERDIVAASPARPFALGGNVAAASGSGEIDPTLSALAGRAVSVAAVPAGTTGRPALAAFLPGIAATDDLTGFRSLLPATDNFTLNATLAKPLSEKISGTLNTRLEFTGSDGFQGLPGLTLAVPTGSAFSPFGRDVQLFRYSDANGPLAQAVRGQTTHVGGTLNGESGDWQWTFTGNYDRSVTRTRTERGIDATGLQAAIGAGTLNPFGAYPGALTGAVLADRARVVASTLTGDMLVSGPLFSLPAGRAQTSVTISGSSADVASDATRAGIARSTNFGRDIYGVKASIDLPIASRRSGVLDALGDLAVNLNGEVQHLSDYGRLTSFGYGVRWSPIVAIRLLASVTHDTDAPSGRQLGDPFVLTPNVTVFDYLRGETVFVSQLAGGNPLLRESERRRIRLQATVKPWSERDLTLTALFTDAKTDDPIAGFPVPTPQIEAAFPGRFVRDATGRLTQIDARPINFAEQRRTDLRWGINYSMALKSSLQKQIEAWRAAGAKPEDRPAALTAMMQAREAFRAQRQREGAAGPGGAGGDVPPPPPGEGRAEGRGPGGGFGGPGGGGRGGFGGGGFGGGRGGGGGPGGGGGRLQFAAFHTWHLEDTLTIGPGVPVLDLLDGAAVGSAGGSPRHEVELQAGYTNNGLGARLSGNWRSATRVDGALGGVGGAVDQSLRFGDLSTLDLRLFANLGQRPEWVRAHPWLAGTRVTLAVTNLFDAKQDVRDASGAVPVRFQPDYLDPLGRRVVISVRKLFF